MRQDSGVDGDAQRISQLCWTFFLKIIDDQDQELELTKDDYRSPIPKKYQWRNWAADPEGITGDALLAFINGELFPALKGLAVTAKTDGRHRMVRDVFEDAYNYMKSGHLVRQVINRINAIDFNNLNDRRHFGEFYEQLLNDLQSAGNAGEYYTPRAVTAFMVDRIDPHPGELLFDPACGTGGFLTCAIRHMERDYVRTPKQREKMQAALRAVEKKPLPHMLCVTNMLLNGVEDPSFVRHDNTLARPLISWSKDERVDIVLTNPPFGGREEDGIEDNFPTFRTKETADLFLALIVRLLKPGGRAAVVLPDGTLFGEGIKTRLKEHLMEECNLHTIVRLPNSAFKPYASIGTNLLFFEKGAPTKDIWFYEHRVPDGQKAYSMTRPIRLEHFQDCIDWWGDENRKGRKETPRAWKVTAEAVKARGYNLDIKNPHSVPDDYGNPKKLLVDLAAVEAETTLYHHHLKTILAEARPINAGRLLKHYERIADAPDAVDRLRRFVLDLAVRGNLEPQNTNDEPATELLKRIAIAKVDRKRKTDDARIKIEPDPKPEELAMPLPRGWAVQSFENLFLFIDYRGNTPPKTDEGIPLITAKNIRMGHLNREPREYISRATFKTWMTRGLPKIGDLFFTTEAPLANICLNDIEEPFALAQRAICFQPYASIDTKFLMFALMSDVMQSLIDRHATGMTAKGIKAANLKPLPIPIPPLAEQNRIVAKVDALMAICDRLEASLIAAAATRRRLLDSLLAEALAPMPAQEREAAE
ncbi:N-6 DNA methylase [Bradyrhizobium sp. sBnM-33]|nr:N-6 DNA methylase [Bradyrhizobium sp. sBnM-33]WOH50696.1 N-6 DNA methylase [Bradyrhizobium sp. sBnM-33]